MPKFPHIVQLCLLFDEAKPLDLAALVGGFVKTGAAAGTPYNIAERTATFFRLYGGTNDVMLTIEFMPGCAHNAAFEWALSSNYMRLLAPDAKERIQRHASHILINVHHGVFGDMGDKMSFMEELGVLAGQTVELFQERLAIAERVAVLIHNTAPVSLVHHVVSNVVVAGPVFTGIATQSLTPHMLQIHPYVYSTEKLPNGTWKYGIKTMGASNFIGREIYMSPSHIVWHEAIEQILVFMRVALHKDGYVIPDGDTVGPQDNTFSYRCTHIPTGQKSDEFDGPLYRLDLLMDRATNFESRDYVKPVRVFDDRTIPSDLKADMGRALPEVEQTLRERREMAEKVGGAFQVRTSIPDPKDEPPAQRGLRRWLPFMRGTRK
jgi:hypothetical protein